MSKSQIKRLTAMGAGSQALVSDAQLQEIVDKQGRIRPGDVLLLAAALKADREELKRVREKSLRD